MKKKLLSSIAIIASVFFLAACGNLSKQQLKQSYTDSTNDYISAFYDADNDLRTDSQISSAVPTTKKKLNKIEDNLQSDSTKQGKEILKLVKKQIESLNTVKKAIDLGSTVYSKKSSKLSYEVGQETSSIANKYYDGKLPSKIKAVHEAAKDQKSSESSNDADTDYDSSDDDDVSPTTKVDQSEKSIKTPSATVKIENTDFTQDDDGKNVMVVYYSVTNTSSVTADDDPYSTFLSVADLTQTTSSSENSLQMSSPSMDYEDSHPQYEQDEGNGVNSKPTAGATVQCATSYEISDTSSPIAVHVKDSDTGQSVGSIKLN